MKTHVAIVALVFLSACSFRSEPEDVEPGSAVETVDPTSFDDDGYEQTLVELRRSEDWTTDDFLTHYAPQFEAELSYDPTQAELLDLVDASSFALTDDERARLQRDGFTYVDNYFPSFAYGYQTIYLEDLPVYVTADAILFAMHRSYDDILKIIELNNLAGELSALLDEMRTQLRQGAALGFTANQESDLDLYLAVAATLLNEAPRATIVGGDHALVDSLVARAIAAEDSEEVVLFGSRRMVDWSQFEPRGHYAGIEELERYFRAMMWLGRIDFRMLEPNEQNELEFRRRQFYDALALAELIDGSSMVRFELIHQTIGAFVGEPDGLVVPQIPALLEALGVEDPRDTKTMSDADIAYAIQKHRFGAQRIASHFMINWIDSTTKPLAHSFALMGQRYVLDSHVFSNVVYDRIGGGSVYRMMPDPLDVAFAALRNDQAGVLLEPQLREYGYQHELDAVRQLADQHDAEFWGANLYNRWLGAIRTLSPADDEGLPGVARTEAWGRRMLQTQLASWAELRHDTILYAKQSYTTGNACEYPDAYIDPYPEFFAAVAEYAGAGQRVTESFGNGFAGYFGRLESAATRLEAMATRQRTGEPHDAADLEWINDAVTIEQVCGTAMFGESGWYRDLFYSNDDVDFDPTIADVHTQPTDAGGTVVGRVLHVGTGQPRGLVVTVETCEGPRAYVGIGSTYYESITENFRRLTDDEWAPIVTGAPVPPDWVP